MTSESNPALDPFEEEFFALALEAGALEFGSFRLKSGRTSPYFFNLARFDSGSLLERLARFYAAVIDRALTDGILQIDILFGPAYKGIPLVAAVAMALQRHYGRDLPWCFNRKETKRHGEAGELVGREPKGAVLFLDDVLTAGNALAEGCQAIAPAGGQPAGIVIALDRQELLKGTETASEVVAKRYAMPVLAISRAQSLALYLRARGLGAEATELLRYLKAKGPA